MQSKKNTRELWTGTSMEGKKFKLMAKKKEEQSEVKLWVVSCGRIVIGFLW
jgi:hypothetical protein